MFLYFRFNKEKGHKFAARSCTCLGAAVRANPPGSLQLPFCVPSLVARFVVNRSAIQLYPLSLSSHLIDLNLIVYLFTCLFTYLFYLLVGERCLRLFDTCCPLYISAALCVIVIVRI